MELREAVGTRSATSVAALAHFQAWHGETNASLRVHLLLAGLKLIQTARRRLRSLFTIPSASHLSIAAALPLLLAVSDAALADQSNAEETDVKSRIIEEVAGKDWEQHNNPYTGYTAGRFSIEGSLKLSEAHRNEAGRLLGRLTAGEFEVIAPTEEGKTLEALPGYLREKPACSAASIRYWNGVSEMSPSQYEYLKSKGSSNLTPYVPGTPRPIDYEIQIDGNLQPVAVARSSFEFYDLASRAGSGLRLFRGEDYAPVKSDASSNFRLEGSFAAFEIPSCRLIGTLDYFTHCIAPRGSPIRQEDEKYLAQVVRVDGKPFVVTVSHSLCDAETSPSQHVLYLWDVTAPGPVPTIYGFSFLERK